MTPSIALKSACTHDVTATMLPSSLAFDENTFKLLVTLSAFRGSYLDEGLVPPRKQQHMVLEIVLRGRIQENQQAPRPQVRT